MPKVFISYRRNEAAFPAGALGRDLRARFGEAQVFRDRENIAAGARWRDQVLEEIDAGALLLVLIGEQWLTPLPGHERSRLYDENDSVRMELLDAIKDGARLIPVLLENAGMPAPESLPPEMRVLCEVNALRLRDADWAYDVERICKALESNGFEPLARPSAKPKAAANPPVSWKTIVALALIAVALMVLIEPYDDGAQSALLVFGGMGLALALWAFRDIKLGTRGGKPLNVAATVVGLACVAGALLVEPDTRDQTPPAASANAGAAPAPADETGQEPPREQEEQPPVELAAPKGL